MFGFSLLQILLFLIVIGCIIYFKERKTAINSEYPRRLSIISTLMMMVGFIWFLDAGTSGKEIKNFVMLFIAIMMIVGA